MHYDAALSAALKPAAINSPTGKAGVQRVVLGAAAIEGKFTRKGSSLSVTSRNQGTAAAGQRVNFKRRPPRRAQRRDVISSGEKNAFLIYFKN